LTGRGAHGGDIKCALAVVRYFVYHFPFFELYSQIVIYLFALLFALQISVAFIKKKGQNESESERAGEREREREGREGEEKKRVISTL